MAREMASSDGSANAGGSCKSYCRIVKHGRGGGGASELKFQVQHTRRTSTTAPRYLSDDINGIEDCFGVASVAEAMRVCQRWKLKDKKAFWQNQPICSPLGSIEPSVGHFVVKNE